MKAPLHGIGYKVFVATVITLVASTVVVGLWLAGSPSTERARREDSQRISDFQSIVGAMDTYYQERRELPSSLEELRTGVSYYQPMLDPSTRMPYEYATTSATTYRLCATFGAATPEDQQGIGPYGPYPVAPPGALARPPAKSAEPGFWNHPAGHYCFEIDEAERVPAVSASSCQLMREAKTGKLDCFGCGATTCKDPAPGWDPYALPPSYVGIPYACTDGPRGCELVQ
jgi:hypothetical protein